MSINRNILFEKLVAFVDERYHFPDKDCIKKLCKIIIFNDPTKDCIYHSSQDSWKRLPRDKSLFFAPKDCGLPIGNLTSQIFANFYLNEFDHFVKKECGITNYGRYVDDCLIVHRSRAFLKKIVPKIQSYLQDNLRLILHPRKIYLQPCRHGVKFLGCFIKPSHIVINHRTIRNFKRSLYFYNKLARDHKPDKTERMAFIASVNSYLGIMKHYRTYKQRRRILKNYVSPFWYKHTAITSPSCGKIIQKREKK
jgi:hypothetical protein